MLAWKPKFANPKVASVRFRCLNPMAELHRRSFPIELFNEARLLKYSGVIFSKLYDEQNYNLAMRLKQHGKAVIFDICDNHFYNPYGLETFNAIRQQLMKMLHIADLIVASTGMLAEILVKEANLPTQPAVIGDAVEETDYAEAEKGRWFAKRIRKTGLTNILWFGIHGGENAPYGMLDLLNQKDLLSELAELYPLQLIVVSDSAVKFKRYIEPLPFRTRYIEWGSRPFRQVLRQIDINIIPISRNPFTLCKTNNRLATALFAGVPTVADEIPSYTDLAPYCILNAWRDGLQFYLENKLAAVEQARSARPYILRNYTIKQIGDAWARHLSPFVD